MVARKRRQRSNSGEMPSISNSPTLTKQRKVQSRQGEKPVKPQMHQQMLSKSSSCQPSSSNPDTADPAVATTTKIVKPIFVDNNFLVVNNFVNGLTLTKKPLLKILHNNRVQISCFNVDDKAKVMDDLKAKHLRFHTFTEPSERDALLLLKGHNRVEPDELLKILIDEGVEANRVTFLRDNAHSPVYIVHFPNNEVNFNVLAHNHKAIGNLIVKWDKLDRRRKKPTQCHRCQLWGHSARNCGHNYKCVKCIEEHLPGQCLRTTRDGFAKCVNCSGDHAANSRQCRAYKDYEARVASRLPAPRRTFNSTPAPWNNAVQLSTDFPPIQNNFLSEMSDTGQPQVSFTQPTSSNMRPSRQSNSHSQSFANAQSRFMSIPDIDITMNLFNSLIDELSATSNHHERMMIMMRHCFPSSNQNAS